MNQSANQQCYCLSSGHDKSVSVYEWLDVGELLPDCQTSRYGDNLCSYSNLEFPCIKSLKSVALKVYSHKSYTEIFYKISDMTEKRLTTDLIV